LIPIVPSVEVSEPQFQRITITEESFNPQNLLLLAYLAGLGYLIYRILRQTLPVFRIIKKSETQLYSSAKLIRTDAYPASFSFFSFVFVNPSIDETETNEIVNHELEHIRQQHWIDLLLFEILRTMQWFNPVSWLYGHLIRQNHEYLADERALQRSSNPAIYRAALLNQMFGGPVISLANSLNYSLNKKRFNMMKQTISSPIRKLKLLLVLPLIAGVFYAFAAPEYKYIQASDNTEKQQIIPKEKTVHGKVISEDGKPLKGATVIIKGTTIGTVTDEKGSFKLVVSDDSPLVISYVGFETVSQTLSQSEMTITLKRKIVSIDFNNQTSETRTNEQIDVNKSNALVIVDGKEINKVELEKISPDKIESISVLKGESAKVMYGEKGKDGIILVTLKIDGQTHKTQKAQSNSILLNSSTDGSGNQPLYLKDGIIIDSKEYHNIDDKTIKSFGFLKGDSAIAKYGEKGKYGVYYVVLKKEVVSQRGGLDQTANLPSRKTEEVFLIVEEQATFLGGDVNAFRDWVTKKIKYPTDAAKNGLSGKVYVQFAVNSKGEVVDVKVIRGVDPSLDKEAVRVVMSSPLWEPAKQRGSKVKQQFTIPIIFNLQDNNAQGNSPKSSEISASGNTIFNVVEEMPSFPGGTDALKSFIKTNLIYPKEALDKGFEGQVLVSFTVDKNGAIKNLKTNQNGVDPSLINAAFILVKEMPKWNPGKQNGENIEVICEIPIDFILPKDHHPLVK